MALSDYIQSLDPRVFRSAYFRGNNGDGRFSDITSRDARSFAQGVTGAAAAENAPYGSIAARFDPLARGSIFRRDNPGFAAQLDVARQADQGMQRRVDPQFPPQDSIGDYAKMFGYTATGQPDPRLTAARNYNPAPDFSNVQSGSSTYSMPRKPQTGDDDNGVQ